MDPSDDALPVPGADLAAWARQLGLEDRPVETQPEDDPARVAARFLAAVVRETFEETGVLLARAADVSGLRAWQRWITPLSVPRRYDTAFFLVAVPAGQDPDRLTTEATPEERTREFSHDAEYREHLRSFRTHDRVQDTPDNVL